MKTQKTTHNTKRNFIWNLTSLMFIWLLGLAPMSLTAGDTWTTKADMPTARWGLSTCVVDGKIYAIGGGQAPHGKYLSTVEEYDPATDTWTTKADMPTARAYAGASVVNGKIYVIGGALRAETSTSAVEEYDPAMDRWTTKADMPTARFCLSTCVVNGKIYATGGGRVGNTFDLSTVEAYDPATDTWAAKADMPAVWNNLCQRGWHSTAAVNGKIYAVGGATFMAGVALEKIQEYDPSTDRWTPKADMPMARKGLSAAAVNGRIYVIGGAGVEAIFPTVEAYDPATDTWTRKADMPTARFILSTSAVHGKVYAIGGSVAYWPWSPTSTVEVYDTGFVPKGVNPAGKLPTLWGKLKAAR